MGLVPIAAIKTNRVIRDAKGLLDLSAQMRVGDYTPVLLRGDMTLIDGLRRIEAAKVLGWDEIDAIQSDDPYEVQEILHEVHGGVMPSLRRIYEFYPVLKQLMDDYYTALKQTDAWFVKNRPADKEQIKTRQLFMRALNVPYGHYMFRVRRLFDLAQEGDPLGQELLRKVESGEMIPGTAFNIIERTYRASPVPVLAPVEQARVLQESARSLSMVTKMLHRLLGRLTVPSGQLDPLIEELKAQRGDLYTMISRLAREADKKHE